VGIPYLCWSVIYFLYGLPASHYASVTAAFRGLASIVSTGYYQLYFLLVIMQFYLAFAFVLTLLRRTRGHHGLVIAVATLLRSRSRSACTGTFSLGRWSGSGSRT
jgi:hypothetical protein